MTAAEDHYRETLRNASRWARKPLLAAIYGEWYERIRAALVSDLSGETVEIGSGLGKIKSHIPECITTDLVSMDGIDRVESAYELRFPSGSVANLVLIDVFHHLRYPGTALDEFARVLQPRGRLVLFEPAMSMLGYVVFGCMHPEALGRRNPITWRAPPGFDWRAEPYYTAQENCNRVFVRGEFAHELRGWNVLGIEALAAFAYLGSGGFSRPQLYPTAALRWMRDLDVCLARFPGLFAARMLVVLEKNGA